MECGQLQSLMSAIASAIVKDADGNVSLNLELLQSECSALEPYIDCNNNHVSADTLIQLIVGEDDCGLPNLKAMIPPLTLLSLSDVYGAATINGTFYKWNSDNLRFEMRYDWDDMRITPGSFDRPGGSDPAYVVYYPNGGAIGIALPEFAINDWVSFTIQLPHGYAEGEDIYVHLHWTPGARGVAENGHTVAWALDYTWANINGTFTDMQTIDLSDACDGTNHKHQKASDVVISGAGKTISSMLLCNLRRIATGDTWATNTPGNLPMILEVDFHYPMNTQGSAIRTSK